MPSKHKAFDLAVMGMHEGRHASDHEQTFWPNVEAPLFIGIALEQSHVKSMRVSHTARILGG
jgi:hypothetical protein